ncbi:hypothetical protein M595_3998 [Lyngbya aestuarii BL J]|uniref:Uncharacterized protein n=1 Tax=Lyngbya aestuarii BL J TaxID=1348334 RepID=U7QG38_9CYAN|nr:hypothetical protein M595_3998 [Lyngbya aestuarii BL J]
MSWSFTSTDIEISERFLDLTNGHSSGQTPNPEGGVICDFVVFLLD